MKSSTFSGMTIFSVSLREYTTFLICVLISLIFLFSSDAPQVEAMRARIVEFSAQLRRLSDTGTRSEATRNELTRLRERMTALMLENSQLRSAALKARRLEEMLRFKQRSDHALLAARVVAAYRDRFSRSIVLDVGKREGVQTNMPIVAPEGLCGKVIRVDETSAIAQLLLDYNFRVAGKIERSRVDGIIAPSGGEMCQMREVPRHADVVQGDIVLTSIYSEIFPPDIPIGIVQETHEDPRSLFKTIRVRPFVDFLRLEDVFVMISAQPDST